MMEWINILMARLRALFRRESVLRDIEEELRIHVEMETETNIKRGMPPDEARAAALKSFGALSRNTELGYDIRGGGWLETLWQDLRYGLRMMLKNPGFTAVAVFSLALGIGANTAIFSLIDVVLLKMLPVERPEQLYFVQNHFTSPRERMDPAPPYPCYERFLKRQQSFSDIAAFVNPYLIRVTIDGQVDEPAGQYVSGNYFSLLGVNAALGRTLSPSDDTMTDGIVAVISYDYWTRRFGQNPAVIGKAVQIGDKQVTIIGVTPPEFYGLYPDMAVDISLPIRMGYADKMANYGAWFFWAVGRLKPGIQVEHARVELDTIYKTYINDLTTGQKFDNYPPDSNIEALEVGH
jgi:hypothetical protein